jgi:exopolyphosphatase/guanosine-5'-triphosphate,3'-diphosphate pyrophosphatase
MADATTVAAVDCGTNSTRLLVARVDAAGVHPLARVGRITRMGAGVDATGVLDAAAIGRVTDVLADYARRWAAAGVDRVAVTATSAARDAGNVDQLRTAARAVSGVEPVVLTGAQEAALTFAGATAGLRGRRVVCDIGGGSTELVVGEVTAQRWTSMPLGSVRLTERHLHTDPPKPAEYGALLADVDAVLRTQPDAFAAVDGEPLIAVAGTALTVAAVALARHDDDLAAVDGAHLSRRAVAAVAEELAWLPTRDRAAYGPITPGREDVVVAGCLLLARLLERFGFTAVRVRVADLLDGTARQLAGGQWPPTPAVPPGRT